MQFYERMPEAPDVVLGMDRATLMGLLVGELDFAVKTGVHPETPQEAFAALLESGDIRLTSGSPQDFALFFSYFEPLGTDPIPITVW